MPRPRAAEAEKPKNETTYVVLSGAAGSTELAILGDVVANGPEQAVRRAAENQEGVFVAIPARNWTIVEQESETPPPVITQKISKWADDTTTTTSLGQDDEPMIPIPAELPPRGPGVTSAGQATATADEADAAALAAEIEDDGA